MLIRRLRIEDFRKLRGPVCIDGIGRGITVIAGDNEEGKSTVLQALRAVLFCRHGSDGIEAKQMLPNDGGGQPRIELDFSIDGRDYRLCKTFLQRPKQAVLTTPTRTFTGGEAEEELQRLLGLEFGKQGLPKPEEQGICGLLWVEQGTGFATPLIGDNGRRALGRALEQELDQVVGGDRAAAVIEAVEQRYSRFFQPKRGREKGVYAEAKQKVEDLQAECARLSDQARSYDALLAELEQVRAALAAHAEAGGIERARADVHRLDAAQRRLDDLRVTRDAATAAEKLARSRLETAVQRQQARAEKVNAQLRTQQEAVRAAVELKEAERALAPLEAALSRAEAEAGEADRAAAQAQSQDEAADRALMRARAAHDLAGLEMDLQLAGEAAAAAERVQGEAAAIIVDDEALRLLREATTRVEKARARVQAAETRIELAPIAGRSAFLGDDVLPTGQPLRLDEPTTLRLEGWGELTIVPGGEDLADRRAAVLMAEEALAAVLASLGVADAAAAEAAALRRRQLTAVAAEAARDLARRAPDGLASLRRAVELKSAEEADLAQGATTSPLLPEAAEAERRQARESLAAFRLRQEQAKMALARAGLERARARDRVLEARALGEDAARRAADLGADLERGRAEESDEALAATVVAARADVAKQEAQSTALQQAWDGEDPERTMAQLQQARAQLDRLSRDVDRLERRDSELLGELRGIGKQGFDEDLTRAEGELRLARDRLARLQREADAVRLLREVLHEARQQAKQQFTEPVRRRLRPKLGRLFDGADLAFDEETLAMTRLHRDGVAEEVRSLSVGTREQLAVLMRLAFAELLLERGCPAPVILDDALVYSDPCRFAAMRQIVVEAGRRLQIIVLTCREDDWSGLGAPVLRLAHCLAGHGKRQQLASIG